MTQSQINQFDTQLARLEEYATDLRQKSQKIEALEKAHDNLQAEVRTLRKRQLTSIGEPGVRWIGEKAFVSDECANALTATFIVEADRVPNALATLVRDGGTRQRVLDKSKDILGLATTRAALDSSHSFAHGLCAAGDRAGLEIRAGPAIRDGLPARRRHGKATAAAGG